MPKLATVLQGVAATLIVTAVLAAFSTYADTNENTRDIERHEKVLEGMPAMQRDVAVVKSQVEDIKAAVDKLVDAQLERPRERDR